MVWNACETYRNKTNTLSRCVGQVAKNSFSCMMRFVFNNEIDELKDFIIPLFCF